jgi:hypothetical protein
MVDRKYKALRCVNQLNNNGDPEIMALHAKIKEQAQITTQVFQALTNTLQHKDKKKPGANGKQPGKPTHGRQPKLEWFNSPPTEPDQVHNHEGRNWCW